MDKFLDLIQPHPIYVLNYKFQQKLLDPDLVLAHLFTMQITEELLALMALCFRYGADANLYIPAKDNSYIHILAFALNLPASKLSDSLIVLLRLNGANSNYPIYDNQPLKINQRSNNILLTGNILEYLDTNSINYIAILLDRPELLIETELTEADICLMIRVFANKCLAKISLSKCMLKPALDNYNSEAYELLIAKGFRPSSLMLDDLIMLYRTKLSIYDQEIKRMIKITLATGVELSEHYYRLIKNKDECFAKEIEDKVLFSGKQHHIVILPAEHKMDLTESKFSYDDKKNNKWYFMDYKLVETGVNPITGEKLPNLIEENYPKLTDQEEFAKFERLAIKYQQPIWKIRTNKNLIELAKIVNRMSEGEQAQFFLNSV